MSAPSVAGGGRTDPARVWLCVIGALVIVPTVIFMQQFARYMSGYTLAAVPRAVLEDETAYAPGVAQLTIESKAWLKSLYVDFLDDTGGYSHETADMWDREYAEEIVAYLEDLALTRVERLRVAIVAGDVLGAEAALERLKVLESEVDSSSPMASEIEDLIELYEDSPAALSESARRSLAARHGWFGRLALVYGEHNLSEERRALIDGGEVMLLYQLGSVGWSILSFLAGVVALIVVITKLISGDIVPVSRVTPGSMVLLETFGLFLVGLLVSVSLTFVAVLATGRAASAGAFAAGEVMMWVGAAALFWPLFAPGARWSWTRYRKDIGLHSGRGVWRELGVGVWIWLAELPLLTVIMIVIAIIETVLAGNDVGDFTDEYPAFDFPIGNSWLVLLIGALGACVWAPIFEEIAFRGVLWRLLRSRLGAAGTIVVTALVFGIIHPYGWQGIVQVSLGGVVFGLCREWRGSLIAPMTVHCLHNTTITLIPLLFYVVVD